MPYPRQNRITPSPKRRVFKIENFKGLDISADASEIDRSNTPDVLNMLLDVKGDLTPNLGYAGLFDVIAQVTATGITGLFRFRKSTGDIILYGHTTKLYKLNLSTNVSTEIGTAMSGNTLRGFYFQDSFYILDGAKFWVYDGTTLSEVAGYIPTIAIGTPPTGGGTAFEQRNYLSAGFIQEFNGNNTANDFKLALDELDATLVTATVGGTAKTETTDFTVNRTTGVVTFTSGTPPTGVNNVIITAYKTVTGHADKIKKCTFFYVWENRVFLSGNPDSPSIDYRSEFNQPTYFPVNAFDEIGGEDTAITGYSTLYGDLVIFKEESIFVRKYTAPTVTSDAVFSRKLANESIGATSPDAIQVIENFPTFLSKKGVYQLVNTYTETEKNVKHISDFVDRGDDVTGISGILDIGSLDKYKSIDFDEKYWLILPTTGEVWVYDYRYIENGVGQWFKINEHYASSLFQLDETIYFGDSRKGVVHRRKKDGESQLYRYDGEPINMYWRSKWIFFEDVVQTKFVEAIYHTLKPSASSIATISLRTDRNNVWEELRTVIGGWFAYDSLDYSAFTYSGSVFAAPGRFWLRRQQVNYIQFEFSNDNTLDRAFGLLNVAFTFWYEREILGR